MAWTEYHPRGIPRRMADEIATRLNNLIQATDALVKHHAEGHKEPLCREAVHAGEMVKQAKEARGALVG